MTSLAFGLGVLPLASIPARVPAARTPSARASSAAPSPPPSWAHCSCPCSSCWWPGSASVPQGTVKNSTSRGPSSPEATHAKIDTPASPCSSPWAAAPRWLPRGSARLMPVARGLDGIIRQLQTRPARTSTKLGWRDAFPDPALQELIATALDPEQKPAPDRAGHGQGAGAVRTLPGRIAFPGTSTLRATELTTSACPRTCTAAWPGIDRQWDAWALASPPSSLISSGGCKNLEESALESYLATEEARRAAHISLVSQVVRGYLTLVGDREHPGLWPGKPWKAVRPPWT